MHYSKRQPVRHLTAGHRDVSIGFPMWWSITGDEGDSKRGPGAGPGQEPGEEFAARPRILIVEDDWFVAADSETILTDAGYEVVGVAATAAEALRLAEAGSPDLVIMDIRLRGDDGIDTARTLLARFGLRCVFSTAYSDPGTRQRAEAAQPLAWITKPYALSHLLAVVDGALKHLGRQ